MNIQDELQKIHHQYGTSEKANYEIQKLFDKEKEFSKYDGVLLGIKICKEMFAQGSLTQNNIYENEVYYKELQDNLSTKEIR